MVVLERPAPAGQAMIRVTGLRKSYGAIEALRGVDVEVAQGEVVALVGPNGAGKTTLVSILSGIRRANAGEALVGGCDVVRDPRAARSVVGVATQEIGVYPRLTVRENLELFARLAGLRGRSLRHAIDETAEALLLAPLLGRPAAALSGGERRRLHTGMALVARTPVVLLDEPTAGSDVETRTALLEVVRRRARDGGSVLYSTHYFAEVEQLEASVVVLHQGRVLAAGGVRSLIAARARTTIRLRFEGSAPPSTYGHEVARTEDSLVLEVEDPDVALARVLGDLQLAGARLREVKVEEPTLEAAYTALVRQADLVLGDEEGGEPC